MLLEIEKLSVAYGRSNVVENVSFSVSMGQIVALIGPNGAGKSTVLKTVGGAISADNGAQSGGAIRFDNEDISKFRTDQLIARGMALVPDGRRIFNSMTVRENLEMGAFLMRDAKLLKVTFERVLTLFPALGARLSQNAASLSGGEQQMLAFGRALMSNPKLLLVDEPSLGLAPKLLDGVFRKLQRIRDEQTIGMLIVEQNVHEVLKIADEVVALKLGKMVYSGDATELRDEDEKLKRIFL